MARNGPIILIEDDADDQALTRDALRELKIENELITFDAAHAVFEFLRSGTASPFMILCNVHLQMVDGIELRKRIDDDPLLKKRSIPFIYLTTDNRMETINEAFERTVQGYFLKADTFADHVTLLKHLIDYWTLCQHPNA